MIHEAAAQTSTFQFLGRNSGRSDQRAYGQHRVDIGVVSIPRSEFWSFGHNLGIIINVQMLEFQFLGRNSGRSDMIVGAVMMIVALVSIPRSEFWSFGL